MYDVTTMHEIYINVALFLSIHKCFFQLIKHE